MREMVFINYNVDKKFLESIKKGDKIRINDWKRSMPVVGVSENFILCGYPAFGSHVYSIIDKRMNLWRHNNMEPDTFICGPDNTVFGYYSYNFRSPEVVEDYLAALESGEIAISSRRGMSIKHMRLMRNDA